MAAPAIQDPAPQPTESNTSQPAQPTQASWRDGIPDEYRNHPAIAEHKDPASLAKWAINAHSLIGRKGVILPKDNDPNDQARFWNELGRPESPEKYDLGDWAPPEGLAWDGDFQKEMLADMHEAGLTNKQVQFVMNRYATRTASRVEKLQQQIAHTTESTASSLKQEWGSAFDARINLASRFVQMVAGDRGDEILKTKLADGSQLGDHPDIVRMFAKAAETIGEDVLSTDSTMRSVAQQTPDVAQSEINQLYADKDFMAVYNDRSHPSHQEFHERMNRLYAIAGSGRGK